MNNQKDTAEVVHGNYEDKYHAQNPISKLLILNFVQKLSDNLRLVESERNLTICEVGCAEGELLKIIGSIFQSTTLFATDISDEEILKAKDNCRDLSVNYSVQNAENLQGYQDGQFDLVVCCEVLEHLKNPHQGLKELSRISKSYILVSVPNEPLWRILNVLRGKYLKDFGNTPGHLNHWNPSQFHHLLVSLQGWVIVRRSFPLPWQMVFLKKVDS